MSKLTPYDNKHRCSICCFPATSHGAKHMKNQHPDLPDQKFKQLVDDEQRSNLRRIIENKQGYCSNLEDVILYLAKARDVYKKENNGLFKSGNQYQFTKTNATNYQQKKRDVKEKMSQVRAEAAQAKLTIENLQKQLHNQEEKYVHLQKQIKEVQIEDKKNIEDLKLEIQISKVYVKNTEKLENELNNEKKRRSDSQSKLQKVQQKLTQVQGELTSTKNDNQKQVVDLEFSKDMAALGLMRFRKVAYDLGYTNVDIKPIFGGQGAILICEKLNKKYCIKTGKGLSCLREYKIMQKLHKLPYSPSQKFVLKPVQQTGLVFSTQGFVTPFYDKTLRAFTSTCQKHGTIKNIAEDLLNGIAFMHSRKIIHRDLKPENIVMNCTQPIIIDFGMANMLSPGCGTAHWASHETYSSHKNIQTLMPADLWSVGLIIYFMVENGRLPNTTKGRLNGSIQFTHCKDRQAQKLIRALIVEQPDNRLTAEQALEHEWFKEPIETPLYDEEKKLNEEKALFGLHN